MCPPEAGSFVAVLRRPAGPGEAWTRSCQGWRIAAGERVYPRRSAITFRKLRCARCGGSPRVLVAGVDGPCHRCWPTTPALPWRPSRRSLPRVWPHAWRKSARIHGGRSGVGLPPWTARHWRTGLTVSGLTFLAMTKELEEPRRHRERPAALLDPIEADSSRSGTTLLTCGYSQFGVA